MSIPPQITHATREEVPIILSLIRDLASYENALSSVHATKASLEATLQFAPDAESPPTGPGYAKTLLIRCPASTTSTNGTSDQSVYTTPSGEIAGMALYFTNYSTWRGAPGVYLEDLYVRPEFRKRGYGIALIKALAAETKRIGGMRLEWCCLRCNQPSLDFYAAIGAETMEDWVTLRAEGDALDQLARTD